MSLGQLSLQTYRREHEMLKPMTYGTPTAEQVAALKAYAAKNGRTWKSKLLADWMGARISEGAILRSVRNDFGPTWLLDRCKLSKLA